MILAKRSAHAYSASIQFQSEGMNMAKRILHCDLCSQGKPRLCVAEIGIVIDEREYPVRVCDRHRAVMKNIFLGVIPGRAFGEEPARTPVKRATVSMSGKKTPAAQKTTAAKSAKKTAVKTTPVKKTTRRPAAAKKATPPAKRGPGRPRKNPVI